MRKTISTQELKASIGEVMDAVRLRGDQYIVQRRGKPVAAVVPLQLAEHYERKRREMFALVREIRDRNRSVPPEEIQEAIEKAIRDVRAEKRLNKTS